MAKVRVKKVVAIAEPVVKPKARVHYVTKADLIAEITKSKAIKKKYPKRNPAECLTPALVEMIRNIVEKFGTLSNWRSYSFQEDMVATAIIAVCNNALKFDPDKSSEPFNYYTMIANRTFLTYIENEKRQRDIRDDIIEMSSSKDILPSFARQNLHEQTQLGRTLDGTRRIPMKRGRYRRRKSSVLDSIPLHTIDSEPPPTVED